MVSNTVGRLFEALRGCGRMTGKGHQAVQEDDVLFEDVEEEGSCPQCIEIVIAVLPVLYTSTHVQLIVCILPSCAHPEAYTCHGTNGAWRGDCCGSCRQVDFESVCARLELEECYLSFTYSSTLH